MEVRVSPLACWYIKRRGGDLYVWRTPVGGASRSALLHHRTRRPSDDLDFVGFEYAGLTVHFERGLDLDRVEIRMSPLGLTIEWPTVIPTV